MKILFIGTVDFSQKMLQQLYAHNYNIVGVCTKKDSDFNSDYFDLSILAKTHYTPTIYVSDINEPRIVEWIKERAPDLILCFGWSQLLKSEILAIPKNGTIGYHPTLLPKNRGRHPLIWALALGLSQTGSTFFMMDENADKGDIISQMTIDIKETDYASDLYDKVVNTASRQMLNFLPKILDNNIQKFTQKYEVTNYWRKRTKMDGEIDWRMSARSIYNLVRALSKPYKGAHFIYKGSEVTVWSVEVVNVKFENLEPGKILNIDESLVINTGAGCLRLLSITPSVCLKEGYYL